MKFIKDFERECRIAQDTKERKKMKIYISPGSREPWSCNSSFFFPTSSRLEIPKKDNNTDYYGSN
jgi:hypothetical protein